MHADYMPAFVLPDIEEGRAERNEMVAEEPILRGTILMCDRFERTRHPVYTDSDWLRDKSIPVCARRDRTGVRDKNLCCRCGAGYPFTPQEKSYEVYSDAAVRL